MLETAPFVLTFKLAFLTTLLLLLLGIPLAYWLAFSRYRVKFIAEAIVSLPLVLPPTVLGFYLLLLLSPENTFGRFLDEYFDIRLVFTFPGLVIASVIYSLPFMVQPLKSGFASVPQAWLDAAHTLGKSHWTILRRVLLPNMKNAFLTGSVLTFAHTVGEFGVILMVGGNIPGETRVVSVAIYNEVEAMNYAQANQYSMLLVGFSFLVLAITYYVNRQKSLLLSYD
ncbi:Molybdenum transport system permease protein ModB [Lunatimonas lonarensis]|uniref:Molybdenum transport system permease n=1 Tax=Lunatimonas lonarensis TaxID=1232681 RepID=R7ZTC9_9BACT|nr:molybdate ABC transporter permease subunit [Lunatimonas lonarensis]EON77385.1 Molybdenum transport system permease protein ModB [Lunatimonas lonarensis]